MHTTETNSYQQQPANGFSRPIKSGPVTEAEFKKMTAKNQVKHLNFRMDKLILDIKEIIRRRDEE